MQKAALFAFSIAALVSLTTFLSPVPSDAQTSTVSATSTPLIITRPLVIGSTGVDVSKLQQFLKDKGYFTYPEITTYYGIFTKQAVTSFQTANNLEAVGTVGPLTRTLVAKLTSINQLQTGTTTTPSTSTTTPTTPPAFNTTPLPGYAPGQIIFGGGGPSAPPDVTAPVLSAIATSSVTSSSITITWTTNEAATSQINFGTTTSYGSVSSPGSLVTLHSVILTGLISGTIYHFQVQSADAQGNNVTSSDQTFTTLYTGAFAALQLAKTRRVDFVYVSDSNGQYNGWGWASGFTIALGNKYGLYASSIYPQEVGGTAVSGSGTPIFNAISGASGATTGAPSAQSPFALPYAPYLFQGLGAIGGSNGIYLSTNALDAYGATLSSFNTAANLRYWMAYGTFATGGGTFRPAARYDAAPFTALVTGSSVNVQTGTDGQSITSLTLPAAVRAHDISFRWQLPGGTASTASTTEFWQRLENQDALAGISVTQLYSIAGKDLYDYATTFSGYTQAQWTNYFNAVTYQQVQAGQAPTAVIFINSGDNDINDVRTSIGPVGGLASNTAAGYADNLAAVVNLVTAGWTGAGLPVGSDGTSGLYFLVAPSHVYGSPDNATLVAMRTAAAAYAAGKTNMSYVDLASLVPYSELVANGGYNAAPHLSNQAYQYVATKLVNTFLH